MELFVAAYGAEAGDLALKLLPYGGLYIAGGIAAKNLPLMQQGFLPAFLRKGRMNSLLKQIPVHVVLNPQVGLLGSALCAAQLALLKVGWFSDQLPITHYPLPIQQRRPINLKITKN